MSEPGFSLRSYQPDMAKHAHNHHQLVLPIAGQLTLQIEAQEGYADAQHLAVIPAGHTHAFAGSDQNRFIVVDLPEFHAPSLAALPAFLPIHTPLQHYIQFMSALLAHPSSVPTATTLDLLLQLLHQHTAGSLHDTRMHAIARSIRNRLSQPLTLPQLAAEACLSERQFRHRFKTAFNQSPMQYLQQQRILLAQTLLRSTTLPIYTIAARTGFNDMSQFSRQFTQHTGISASEYRRNSQTLR